MASLGSWWQTDRELLSLHRQYLRAGRFGGPRTRITKDVGSHAGVWSPDERWIADVYSYTTKPPEVYVQESRPQAAALKLTTSPSPEFASYPWLDAPIESFAAR